METVFSHQIYPVFSLIIPVIIFICAFTILSLFFGGDSGSGVSGETESEEERNTYDDHIEQLWILTNSGDQYRADMYMRDLGYEERACLAEYCRKNHGNSGALHAVRCLEDYENR